ncbi:MAG: 30S ribosomal protein S8 [Rickettsiales bacterium]|nr:30S ribosomal protein S8 [Rickettsiales bacterium]
MSSNHSVSDLITRVRNGYLAKRTTISSPVSNLREDILKILKEEGFILSYTKIKTDGIEKFDIHLKYHYSNPVVSEITVVSKPGKRVYCRADEIPSVKNGLGMVIISTSKGVISDHEARLQKLGGEVLLKIF